MIHEGEMHVLKTLPSQRFIFGVDIDPPPPPDRFLNDNDKIQLRRHYSKRFLHTATHRGICIHADGIYLQGDTLFAGSIGRTDLPGTTIPQQLPLKKTPPT